MGTEFDAKPGVRVHMNSLLVASLVGSSHYAAVRDDSLKDEDNAAWVMELPKAERQEWVERIRWIRLVDRLAEKGQISAIAPEITTPEITTPEIAAPAITNDTACTIASDTTLSSVSLHDPSPSSSGFDEFYQIWQGLRGIQLGEATVFLQDNSPQGKLETPLASILEAIAHRWFQPSQGEMDRLSIQSWDSYVSAIAFYHGRHTEIQTLDDYETMIDGLAGSFFQILPYLQPHHWDCARHFGIVDQFYNNLRDLHEDLQQGICYFPAELLDNFGVTRESVLDGSCIGTENYRQLMEFWVGDYLLTLRRRAHGLLLCSDLHPSWLRLRAWCLRRYERIEQVMRQCQFDFVKFSQCYWQVVQEDLHHYRQLGNDAAYGADHWDKAESCPSDPPEHLLQAASTPQRGQDSPSPAASLALARVSSQEPVTWCWAIAHFLKLSPAAVVLSQNLFICLERFQGEPFKTGDRLRHPLEISSISSLGSSPSTILPQGYFNPHCYQQSFQREGKVGANVPIVLVKGSSNLLGRKIISAPVQDNHLQENQIQDNMAGHREGETMGSQKAIQLLRVLRSQRFQKDRAAYYRMMWQWKNGWGDRQQWALKITKELNTAKGLNIPKDGKYREVEGSSHMPQPSSVIVVF